MTESEDHATIQVRASAKINLHLGVGRARPDGFHPLHTIYQAISLYDDLTVTALAAEHSEHSERSRQPEQHGTERAIVSVDAGHAGIDVAEVPTASGRNIIHRAADLLAEHHGRPHPGHAEVSVHVHKSIPVAGGMAGGSADGAAALVALDRLWGLHTPDDALLALAAELGSDVPFSLIGGTAAGVGRGEVVEPLRDESAWWWVVVPTAHGGLSTPAVYRHFDELRPDAPQTPGEPTALIAALRTGDPAELAATLHNDLQTAAVSLRPDLGDLLAAGEQIPGVHAGMVSGSGPTCVFLCAGADASRAAAAELRSRGHAHAIAAHGPVAGAHLVVS